MKTVWSKLPSRWIRDGGLRAFQGGDSRGDAAALKLYMTLALFANFKPIALLAAGSTRMTFSDLEQQCEVSRRYIALGLRRLESQARIVTQRIGNTHCYVLADYEETGWAKLPRAHLLDNRRLPSFGIRGALHLDALKLYLTLVTFRANDASQVLLSYDKIEYYTGIARRHIRRTIDVLLNHEWIAITSYVPESRLRQPMNIYLLRGDFWGRAHGHYVRAAATTVPPQRPTNP
jgi:hypothetical protein